MMVSPPQQKRNKRVMLGIPLLCTLIVFGIISLSAPLFQDWENKTRDYRFKLRGQILVSPDIVLIDIDDRSIAKIGRWPWNRSIHAEMIHILSKSGASVIGYDILFNQATNEVEDLALEKAIQEAEMLYLPTGFELSANPPHAPRLTVKREIGPISRLRKSAAGIGHISSNRDSDGTIRSVPLFVQNGDAPFPAFAIALLRGHFKNTRAPQILSVKNEIVFQTAGDKTTTIPINNKEMMDINYAGPWVSTFTHYPFAEIRQAWQDKKNHQYLKTAFEGKIIIVSNTATGYDLKPVPVESDYPGGGIHANIINTILTGQYLEEPGTVIRFSISLFLSIIVSSILFLKKSRTALPIGLGIGFFYLVLTQLFFKQGFNLPVLFPLLSLTVTSLSSLLYQNTINTRKITQLTEEKGQVSEKFKAAKTALASNEITLTSKRAALAQLTLENEQVKENEQTRNGQIKALQNGLEKSEKEHRILFKKKQMLEEKVNQFSIAKMDDAPLQQDDLEILRKEAARHGLITKNRALLEDFARIKKVAHSSLPILVLGETGTGKELIAHIVHAMNTKTNKKLVTVNTPAIPETLFDSTLFGYAKGAFNDARSDRPGKFQEADGGTLFLDEIGEIPPQLQSKLLRAVETGEIDRVGATKPDQVKVQIVSATNRPLDEKESRHHFRSDLFFRLGAMTIKIPPLRERKEDLEALLSYFLERTALQNQAKPKHLSKEALLKIKSHDWPGNVRELKNRIQKAFALAGSATLISASDLGFSQNEKKSPQPPGTNKIESRLPRVDIAHLTDKDLSDTDFIRLLKHNKFNKTLTAAQLDLKPLAIGSRFRGICLKIFDENKRDLQKAAECLSKGEDNVHDMRKKIDSYYQNLIKSVQHFQNSTEAIKYCEAKLFGNIKKKYRPSMKRLILNYFESKKETEA